MLPGGRRFVSNGSSFVAGAATTSALASKGSSFTVSFYDLPLPPGTYYARRAPLGSGYLKHSPR
jgi:hypothetical protein